jgi:hypothetical protein
MPVLLGIMKPSTFYLMVLMSTLKPLLGVFPMLEMSVDLLGLITSMKLISLLITPPNS